MKRAQMRENTFKLLFCKEFHDASEMEEQCRKYLEDVNEFLDEDETPIFDAERIKVSDKEKEYIINRVNDIIYKIEEIDSKINEVSVGWKTDRIGKVELTILRLAYFEMEYDEEIPKKVAIDQAVELAKKYGSDASPSFINGILAKLF